MRATLRNTQSNVAEIPSLDPPSTKRFPDSEGLPPSSRETNEMPHHQEGFEYRMENPRLPRIESQHQWISHQPVLLCYNTASEICLPRACNMKIPRNTNFPRTLDLPRSVDLPRSTDLHRNLKSQCIMRLPRQDLHYDHGLPGHELSCNVDLRSQTGLSCRQDANYNKVLPARHQFTVDLNVPCNQRTTNCAVTSSEESWTVKFRNLQRLLEAQEEILRNQSRTLEQCEHQLDNYLLRTHYLRISEDGDDYIQRAYMYLETFGKDEDDELTSEDNSTHNADEGAPKKDDGTTAVEKFASTEVNECRESRQQAISGSFISDCSDLVEVEKLRQKLTKLVARGDDCNRQLIQLSCQIAHYDGEIACKRLQLKDLQEQSDKYDLMNTFNGTFDQFDCPAGGVSVQPILHEPIQKRSVDCSSDTVSRLFLTAAVESDTGLSSLGSDSSFDLSSPAGSRHKLDEIPLKYGGHF